MNKTKLTAVEDTDFLENVRAVACPLSEGRSLHEIVSSSDWLALEDDCEGGADGEENQKDYYPKVSFLAKARWCDRGIPKIHCKTILYFVR